MNRLLAAALLVLPVAVGAQQAAPVPEPPRYPAGVEPVEEPAPEPDVTIVERERDTVYEYRINGRLYMIKVVPQVGPPYYFIDQDGDGNMETRATDYTQLRIPQWVLATW
jgi:Protein of unknown function (DUF2782)